MAFPLLAMIMPLMIVAVMMMRPMPMGMMMHPLTWPWPTRVVAENQRLDGDRHGIGRHADAAEIDVVEVHQDDAINDQDLARDVELFAQDRAQSLGYVAIQHDVDRLAVGDTFGKAALNARRKSGEALVGWRALPAQRERDFAVICDVEGHHVTANG